MLTKFHKSEKGFTLIELLIVVAIIGILAAIAIPQFSAYRQRGYNAAANSDLRNTKTTQEALFADRQSYGVSNFGVTLAAPGINADANPGATILGPMGPATDTVNGGVLGTFIDTDANGARDTSVGMGVGASSNVNLMAGTAGTFGQYIAMTQHRLANRAFSTTGGGPAVCYVENETWTTVTNEAAAEATAPANIAITCAGQPGGGVPVANWVAL